MIVDDMLETSFPKEIGPELDISVCEGIHTFLNIYMDFKYRFAGLWDFGDWVSLLLSRGSADSQKCLFCPKVLIGTPLDGLGRAQVITL